MRNVNRYLGSLLLAAAVLAPTLVVSTAQAQDVNVRVYDRDHHDYHNWDDHENLAYRRYLDENHREYREYNRLNRRDQRAYWNWRHSHPD
jgi:type III secretory pathway component EscR